LPTLTSIHVSDGDLLDIKPKFGLPSLSLHTPAMELFFVLLTTLVSQPLLNLGEGMVI
jgi:hypothetical protein